MKLSADTPFKRIVIAVALSLLLHSLFLWQWPNFKFRENIDLPPLQVKLVQLPKLAKKSVARKRKAKAKPVVPPHPVTVPVVTPAAPLVAAIAASAIPATSAVAETTTETATPAPTTTEETSPHPLLPKHALLKYAVQYGSGTFKVGEVIHRLENINGRYTLRSETQTTGLVGIFKHYSLIQRSSGLVTRQGLRPDSYMEEKSDSSGKRISTARFDWDAHKIYFSNGTSDNLPAQAQDLLSLPYQLSQQALNVDSIPVALGTGKNISQYYIAVGEEVTIHTAMGELRTIPLSKVHGANEEGLIIWLALEYRLLPVKILYLDKSGEVSANMVITDIRVSDE